ncbi:hypothetical protein GIB67_011623, partial [Kingdonia uniflora]
KNLYNYLKIVACPLKHWIDSGLGLLDFEMPGGLDFEEKISKLLFRAGKENWCGSRFGVMAAKAAGMKVVAIPSIQSQADPLFCSGFWVMNALPIKGLLQKGFLYEVADDGPSSLVDQVSGVYFGWAKLNTNEILKVVVGIGWKWDSCTTRRLIVGNFKDVFFFKHIENIYSHLTHLYLGLFDSL